MRRSSERLAARWRRARRKVFGERSFDDEEPEALPLDLLCLGAADLSAKQR